MPSFVIRTRPSTIQSLWRWNAGGYWVLLALEITIMSLMIPVFHKCFAGDDLVSPLSIYKIITKHPHKKLYIGLMIATLLLVVFECCFMFSPIDVVGFFFQRKSKNQKDVLSKKDLTPAQHQYLTKIQDQECHEYDSKAHEHNAKIYDSIGMPVMFMLFLGLLIQVMILLAYEWFYTTPHQDSLISKYHSWAFWVLMMLFVSNALIIMASVLGLVMFFRLTPYHHLGSFSCKNLDKIINLGKFHREMEAE